MDDKKFAGPPPAPKKDPMFEADWKLHKDNIVPGDASEEEIERYRRAFYQGGLSMSVKLNTLSTMAMNPVAAGDIMTQLVGEVDDELAAMDSGIVIAGGDQIA